ncbi:hypothetical protein [Paenibacillus tundrae]
MGKNSSEQITSRLIATELIVSGLRHSLGLVPIRDNANKSETNMTTG